MEARILKAEPRTAAGSGPARRLRKSGKIPAVIYGHHDPETITIDAREFGEKFNAATESSIIHIDVDGKGFDVVVKDYQFEVLTGRVLHLDFFEIERGKKLKTHVAVHTTGEPAGVRDGGVLTLPTRDLEIECLPEDIPEEITIDISHLQIGEAIHVTDITAPKGVAILSYEDQIIALVEHQRLEVEPAEEEEAAVGELEGEEAGAQEAGEQAAEE